MPDIGARCWPIYLSTLGAASGSDRLGFGFMRYSRIPGVADPISRCVLGTSGIRSEDRHRLLDAFLEAGGNCIDTARAYGGGSAEESVGGWIRKAKPDGLIVIAKGAHRGPCRRPVTAGRGGVPSVAP